MELLVKTKWVLTWLGMFPLDTCSSKQKIIAVVLAALTVLTISSAGSAAHLAFFQKFWTTNPKDSLFAACGVVTFGSNSYVLMVAFSLRHKISAIFDGLSKIYDDSK